MSRVLVVEDDPAILRGLADNLGAEGYEVRTARTGEESLRLIRDERPDLVVLDLMLPGLSGFEVCRRLRREGVQATPVLVAGGHTFRSVTAGIYHTCGLTTAGSAVCWGYNGYGQLGLGGSPTYASAPALVTGGHTFSAVNAGGVHTCAVTMTGAAYCWGLNNWGQLGDGTFGVPPTYATASPAPVGGGHAFASVEAGWYHTCGVASSGQAHCWGYNRYGQLGAGTVTPTWPYGSPSPTLVVGGHSFHVVSSGGYHSCGVATSGDAYCWGLNHYGQLGDGTITPNVSKPSPVPVIASSSFASISAGLLHRCGAAAGRAALCWGYNGAGRVGDGTFVNRASPVFVMDLNPPTP